MNFTFNCPIDGCEWSANADALNRDDALAMLASNAKEHVATNHPDLGRTHEEVNSDVSQKMRRIETDPMSRGR